MNRKYTSIRIYLYALLFMFTGFALIAQHTVSNPNDRLYAYLNLWEEQGLIGPLPLLRPYPLQVVRPLLEKVREQGTEADKQVAEEILAVLNGKQGFRLELVNTSRAGNEGAYESLQFNMLWRGEFSPFASYALNAGVLIDTEHLALLPRYMRPDTDNLYNWAYFDINGLRLNVGQSYFGTAALGNKDTFFQTGLVRNSFGPFYENGAVLGPQAPHAGHFSFTHQTDSYSLNFLLLALIATNNWGESRFPQKYLSMQSINWYPLPWLELGIFESVVYGSQFNPVYLLPMVEMFYSQSYYGVGDNSFFGFMANFKLPRHIRIKTQLFADDLHFNDLIRFDFDTKYKVSLQTGVTWTPGQNILKRISFDYLLVTPYMYTHKPVDLDDLQDPKVPNYLNYTNDGLCLGTVLEPNSDQFTLSLWFKPLSWLEMVPFTKWIRHGNASAGLTDGAGDIFDPGYDTTTGKPVFQDTTRFLTQNVLEHIWQLGCEGYLQFSFPKVQLQVQASYVFEVALNNRLVSGEHLVRNYGKLSVLLSY